MKNKKNLIFLLTFVLSSCTFLHRCDNIGCEYLDVKYISDPLGEENAPDNDPLIRYDAFDCVTFVETVLADGNLAKLNKIRYKDSKIDFLNRNHFIEYDWVKNNSEIIENVNKLFGKTKIRNFTINKKEWFKKVHNIDTDFPEVSSQIEYIPYSDLNKIKTDKTLLVLFVMDNPKIHDKLGTDLAVSHMGFLLTNGILRHASLDGGKVVDINFFDYVNARKKSKTNLGIALYKIK
ncbi:MAG: DUF1460 domain-containing protein [Alphaproteobacteria bacterium]|nr:DUF1460 domain-containing protein [Alphaproteobacteria bacterium]MBN2675231.1 DUF1460 domain-containing protein [Alphaproteobacteria bacterium]